MCLRSVKNIIILRFVNFTNFSLNVLFFPSQMNLLYSCSGMIKDKFPFGRLYFMENKTELMQFDRRVQGT